MARRPMTRPSGRRVALLGLVALLLVLTAPPASASAGVRASVTPTEVTGNITGPGVVGTKLVANFTVEATGGLRNSDGSLVGIYNYSAKLSGPNTTDGLVTPSTGHLSNGKATMQVTAPSHAQLMTLTVIVNSTAGNGSSAAPVSKPLTFAIEVVQPYELNTTLTVGTGESVGPFRLAVDLDGSPVGTVAVPLLQPNSTYPVVFKYVVASLSPGWHTFSISLLNLHGLVRFPNGAQVYSVDFYVPSPPTNFVPWYVAGTLAFAGAVFIWLTWVGARRRGKPKK